MSANLILEHVFSLDEKKEYQTEIMKCLTQITSRKKISNDIVQFFGQVDDQAPKNSHCNFEMQVIHPDAPLFSKKEENFFKIYHVHNL
jgi:hypothetical protein